MIKKHAQFLIGCIALSLVACNDRNTGKNDDPAVETPAVAVIPDSIIFYTTSLYFSLDSCQIQDENCTYIRMQYPVIEDGPQPVTDSIRKQITKLLQVYENTMLEPEASADMFLSSYTQYNKEFSEPGEQRPPWYMKKNVNVTYSSKRYFCFSMEEESYTGGAHGMYFTTYFNMDLQSGKRLELNDIIKPEKLDALTQIGEKIFRLTKNIPEDKSISSTGFFSFARHDSLVGKFYLNDNFSMGNNGLIFHYNVYEIASYVSGASKIVIPYSRLKEIALPGSLLEERIMWQ